MPGTTRTSTWRDRWVWVVLAVAAVVVTVVVLFDWRRSVAENDRITDHYVCAIETGDADC